MPPQRKPEEIRESIEENRVALVRSVDYLRQEVAEITDWRKQIARNPRVALGGAAVAGFLVGGGVAAVGSVLFGRRKRRRR
jgi:dienelactone hydrolase